MKLSQEMRTILEAATYAPSGENAQPWRFLVREGGKPYLDVCLQERDHSLYGWGERASYVAVGAALQNIKIAAAHVGFVAHVDIFPTVNNAKHVAHVNLTKTVQTPQPLFEVLKKRVTNRKPYTNRPLTSDEVFALQSAAADVGYGELHLTSDPVHKKMLAEVGSCNEKIMLNNQHLHDFFFDHVNWTRREDEEKKVGFFIDTLELPLPAKIGFRVMRSWRRAKRLNQLFGFNKFASAQNALIYAQAAAFGIVISPRESADDAVRAGMVVQRVWLEATRLGLSIQPVVGVLYFALRVRSGEDDGFSSSDLHIIHDCDEKVRTIFPVGEGVSYFMFRVGHAAAPSARSVRFPVEEVTTIV